jgi:hypothetical protein
VVGRRNGNHISDRAAMAATRRPEPERTSGGGSITMTGAEPSLPARDACTAGHLERDQYPFTNSPLDHLIANGHDLGDELVPDREWPGKDPLHGHWLIEITSGHGDRPQQRSSRVQEFRRLDLLPLDSTGFGVDQLTHTGSLSQDPFAPLEGLP